MNLMRISKKPIYLLNNRKTENKEREEDLYVEKERKKMMMKMTMMKNKI